MRFCRPTGMLRAFLNAPLRSKVLHIPRSAGNVYATVRALSVEQILQRCPDFIVSVYVSSDFVIRGLT